MYLLRSHFVKFIIILSSILTFLIIVYILYIFIYCYSMKKSKKYLKGKTRTNKKTLKNIKGGHSHETEPHYHLFVKVPKPKPLGKVLEIPEKFLRSNKEKNIQSAKVKNIINFVIDRGYEEGTFNIFWRGKKLKPNTKLRHVKVGHAKLPIYRQDINDALEVRLIEDQDEFVSSIDEYDITSTQTV